MLADPTVADAVGQAVDLERLDAAVARARRSEPGDVDAVQGILAEAHRGPAESSAAPTPAAGPAANWDPPRAVARRTTRGPIGAAALYEVLARRPDVRPLLASAGPPAARPPRPAITIHNDDRTPMDFVVRSFEAHLGLVRGAALRTALRIQAVGAGAVAVPEGRDPAAVLAAMRAEAAAAGHPLRLEGGEARS